MERGRRKNIFPLSILISLLLFIITLHYLTFSFGVCGSLAVKTSHRVTLLMKLLQQFLSLACRENSIVYKLNYWV